jgi:hypothetical protein
MPYLKIPKGKKTKNKSVKPVVGFGNIQFNVKEDVEKAKKVQERDVFDKPKNKGTNKK